MKLLRLAIVLVILCYAVSSFAMTPEDLIGGEVVAQGRCSHFGILYDCVGVEKDGSLYLVMSKGDKNVALYKVKELKHSYHPHEMELMWSSTII